MPPNARHEPRGLPRRLHAWVRRGRPTAAYSGTALSLTFLFTPYVSLLSPSLRLRQRYKLNFQTAPYSNSVLLQRGDRGGMLLATAPRFQTRDSRRFGSHPLGNLRLGEARLR